MIRNLKNKAHLALGVAAASINLFPSRGLTIVGVTGTDGKTTTSNLLYHILREAGKKVAVISTIGAIIDGTTYETGFHVTTPSPFAIQKYLKIAKKKGCTHVILEVTSHALDQSRVWGIHFAVGVLTNITHEHLDYHKSYERYVATKLRLFSMTDKAVVNSNGEWYEQVINTIPKSKLLTYSLHGNNKDDLSIMTVPFEIKTKLIGDFNLENILAAIAASRILGIEDATIDKAIQSFDAPVGRQEEVVGEKHLPTVMVDFAHTANSFENILPEVRKRTTGRLIHVFGAAGERDIGKRPEMGRVASFYDDIIILTSEDPRSENIEDITLSIAGGINEQFVRIEINEEPKEKSLYVINDRRQAIKFALSIAKKDDTIIITGKGHEKTINYGNGEEEWSDQKVVKQYIKK